MIPLKDHNPTRIVPFVTWTLVFLNVFVFFLQFMGRFRLPDGLVLLGLMEYSLVPREVITGQNLPPFDTISPAWLTMFTSMFLHGSWLHLGSNMLYLIVFGNNIEDRLGHFRFLLFYIASGFLAALAHIISGPLSPVPTVGASGAVAGILGAYILLYPHARITCLVFLGIFITTFEVPAVIVLGIWILGQLGSGFLNMGSQVGGGVAYWAHIGGFFAGILLLRMLDTRRNRLRGRL